MLSHLNFNDFVIHRDKVNPWRTTPNDVQKLSRFQVVSSPCIVLKDGADGALKFKLEQWKFGNYKYIHRDSRVASGNWNLFGCKS